MLKDDIQDIAMDTSDESQAKKWRECFDVGEFQVLDCVQFLEKSSSKHYKVSSRDPLTCTFDEESAQNAILGPLEEFICGDNPQNVFERIATEGSVSSVCGHVFKLNEPTYSCRECGVDSTCVLCVSCFKQSPHKTHKYKMGTSSGGGCCDCGDVEAWKRDHACTIHANAREVPESAVINEQMRERCALVIEAIIKYCISSFRIDADYALKGTEPKQRDTPSEEDDIFCTVMYNDELHTFEQVIATLTRIIGCKHREAIDFVSRIDREGRAVVKCAPFDICMNMREKIEMQDHAILGSSISRSPPLKVSVLHMDAVALQLLALKLLAWLQDFCTKHAIFRQIFGSIVLRGNTYIQHIMLYDSKLWKTARLAWHHLIITAMLMEYDNKKKLALVFSKIYPTIMSDFLSDDHDHSFSVVSLSVQLFTVPSIAALLIATDSVFYKLMHTFYSESIERFVSKQVLIFQRPGTLIFRRSSYILYDLKYILTFRPDAWTDDLRKNFLHGVQVFLRMLKEMQGMDSVNRQTGQHMEYEPEWESAFNLHIRLSNLITMVLDWCGSDKIVLVKVYRLVMASLAESEFILANTRAELKSLAGHQATVLMYDVLTKSVSIHLPLSRFFAALYLHIYKYGYSYDDIMGSATKLSPEEIMEPVLCALTMVAQVHAGLWRRNGYSLLNQIYFYRNVKCRGEMLDRDIAIMQMGGSLIEPNKFLIRVMSKFDLLAWARPDFEKDTPEEESIRQTVNMLDELLELLIMILGERYTPGVGQVTDVDRLRKELIQQLCIQPMSHSELGRSLSDTQQAEAEEIVRSVASFQKPSASDKKGVYVLKPEFYDEYNTFFYHYTKEERSKSDETHRARRIEAKLLDCCPPPKLPRLCKNFESLNKLFYCDVMLFIMKTVLVRSIDLKARHFAENHVHKVLHLIGYALHEAESGAYPGFDFLRKAAEHNLLPMIEELSNSPRVELHHDLMLWTIRRFSIVQAKCQETDRDTTAPNLASEPKTKPDRLPTTPTDELMDSESGDAAVVAVDAAVPADPALEQAENDEKKARQKLAALRRAAIMAQMQSAQKNFMSTNAELFKSTDTETSSPQAATSSPVHGMDWQATDEAPAAAAVAAQPKIVPCLGPDSGDRKIPHEEYTCILCSEDTVVHKQSRCMVYSAFIQTSKVMAHANNGRFMPHLNSCGHVMHAECFAKYFENEAMKETRRPNRTRAPGAFHIDKKEYLCPLCRCLNNVVVPIQTSLSYYSAEPVDSTPMPFADWLRAMEAYAVSFDSLEKFSKRADLNQTLIGKILPDLPADSPLHQCGPPCPAEPIVTDEMMTCIRDFIEMTRNISPIPFSAVESEPYLVTWLACAYTVESIEMQLRFTEKPLKGNMSIRQTSALRGLLRTAAILGGVISNLKDSTASPRQQTDNATVASNLKDSTTIPCQLTDHVRGLLNTAFAVKKQPSADRAMPSVVIFDVFKMMASMVFMMPALMYAKTRRACVPNGHLMEYYMLRLMHVANVVKIMLLHNEPADAGAPTGDATPDDGDDSLVAFYKRYNFHADARCRMTRQRIDEIIAEGSATYLRSSVLLFSTLTDVPMPDELQQKNTTERQQYDVMCAYLGLTVDFREYLRDETTLQYARRLATNPKHAMLRRGATVDADAGDSLDEAKAAIVPYLMPISSFVQLPDDYSDVINTVSQYSCPNNMRDDARNPSMCLLCGAILCSMTYCCQSEYHGSTVGACTAHTMTCGAGVCPFLRVRDCEVLLLGYDKGCFVSAPYLDEYGETDQGLRRGNALRLCRERLRKLHLMWLSHCIHENIARFAETSNSIVQTHWLNM